MAKIFSFCNQKGGVGKTTTALNLAACIGEKGRKVLLVDIDPQGNATSGLGLNKNEAVETIYELIIGKSSMSQTVVSTSFTNLYIIQANAHLSGAEVELVGWDRREFLLKDHLDGAVSDFDFVFVDCPPSLGLLTLNALSASDGIIIPLQCEYYALEGLGQLLETFQLVREKLNPKLQLSGIILTMADFRTNLTEQVIDDVRGHFREQVFESVIPRAVRISEAPSFGKPAVVYARDSKGALAYRKAADEFLARFGTLPLASEAISQNEGTSREVENVGS